MISFVYNCISFFKYFDAFELDVNVVNFVYYGKLVCYTTDEAFFKFTADDFLSFYSVTIL